MREEDLRLLLQRVPFPLLRLHTTGGEVFDIRDPDAAHLERSTVQLLLPSHHNQQREAVIALVHVVWVEVINPPT
jgi:hypothetical protein